MSGSLYRNWHGAVPAELAGMSPAPWNGGVRLTGSIQLDAVGSYTFRVANGGGMRVWMDGTLSYDRWVDGLVGWTTAVLFNNPAVGPHRFRIDYYHASVSAYLNFRFGPNPEGVVDWTAWFAERLSPGYSLSTSTVSDDAGGVAGGQQECAAGYLRPEFGLATLATVDPAGLNLTTLTATETSGAGLGFP